MQLSQVLMMLVVVAGIGGYYWWTVVRVANRGGGGVAGWQRAKLGLREGEQLMGQWMACFDYDESTGEKVFNVAAGLQTRGKSLYVGLTNMDRLVIGFMEEDAPPMGFERGQVVISHFADKAKVGKLSGMQGMEKAQVIQLTPLNQSQFRLQIATSACQTLESWARRAA